MKILIINDHLGASGGTETFIYALKENLEKKGHRVKILGSEKGENIISIFSRWYSRKWYKKTQNLIKKFKPDIVHVNNCIRVISPSVIDASLDMGVPVVLTFHDFHYLCQRLGGIYEKNRPKKYKSRHRCFFPDCLGYREEYKDFPRNLWKRMKIILHRKLIKGKNILFVSPSKILAKSMEEFLKVPIKVINNGIDIPKEKARYQKSILFVGELNQEKGLHTIAGVLNNTKEYKVLVLGKGPLKKSLESKYRNIKFLGFQKPEKYYKEAAIAVVPSIWMENFSYSVLEAMSYGLCVIASDIGGIPEQIKHMKTGLIFERENKEDFKKKLNYLIKNPKEVKRIGKNARKFVKKNFNWNKIVKEYEKSYTEAIIKKSIK